jgi:hypothetical protein
MTMQQLCCKVWNYARDQYWELPANILEGITLVSQHSTLHSTNLCDLICAST